MSKKNFVPLCMIPFIANMMGGKPEQSGEEPEQPYYTIKKLDFFISLFKTPAPSGSEAGPCFFMGIAASPELLAAVNAGKDILFPADFTTDISYFVPEGVTEETLPAYVEGLYEAKREEYPYLITPEPEDPESQMFNDGFSKLGLGLMEPEGDALWKHGTGEAHTYGFDGVEGSWSWHENEHDGQHYIVYESR